MRKDIEQPSNLKIPDVRDPIRWADMPRLQTEWLKVVAPQLELDSEKILLGLLVDTIIPDDENSFNSMDGYYPKLSEIAKQSIFIRLDWEISLEGIPEDIHDRLVETRKRIDLMAWDGEENYTAIREYWDVNVKAYVQERLQNDIDLQSALQYHTQANEIWGPYWHAFLYGEHPFA